MPRVTQACAMVNAIKLVRRKVASWTKDTQQLRIEMIESLREQYQMCCRMARGEVTPTNLEGKQERITMMQRKEWAKAAKEIAMVIDSMVNSFDAKQIDTDLKMLEDLINEARNNVAKKLPANIRIIEPLPNEITAEAEVPRAAEASSNTEAVADNN